MTMRIQVKPYGKIATFYFALYDPTDPSVTKSGLSFEAGDSIITKDGAAAANTDSLPVEIGSTGIYKVVTTTGEMEALDVVIKVEDQTNPAVFMAVDMVVEITAWRTATDKMQVWEVNEGSTPTSTSFSAEIRQGVLATDVDAYKDRQILFISGTDPHAVTFIESWDGVDAFTCTQIPTGAPTNGDRFVIV